MTASWTVEQIERMGESSEVQIASRRSDGSLRPSVPIWVVCCDESVYVRTWYRRRTGWYGQVLEPPSVCIHVVEPYGRFRS